MKIKQEISAEILNAATAVLSPYILDLTATVLLQALESYNADKEAIPAKHSQCPEKPFTREAAAEMLGLSLSRRLTATWPRANSSASAIPHTRSGLSRKAFMPSWKEGLNN